MTILLAASEVAPMASSSALGEAIAALPRHLSETAMDVAVALPGYPQLMEGAEPLEVDFNVPMGGDLLPASVYERVLPDGTQLLLIRNDALFNRPSLYADQKGPYPDNAARFIFFSKAVVELAQRLDPQPEVLHLHDWQTALVPLLVREQRLPYKTVLSIYNAAYQGNFWALDFPLTNLPSHWLSPSGLEFYEHMNLLKGGILHADALTTPSEVYRAEILSPKEGCGLEGALNARAGSLSSIRNGVDPLRWSPQNTALAAPYSNTDRAGKLQCRNALLSKLKLQPDPTGPVFVMQGRLADQKGFDLLLPLLPRLLAANARLIIAGDGDAALRRDLLLACRQHPAKLAFVTQSDFDFPVRLLAGGDILLQPSHWEPSGVQCLNALAFGTIPLAHATGGILENLTDFDPATRRGNALLYFNDSREALWDCLVRASRLFEARAAWRQIMDNAMESRFPWSETAAALVRLYRSLAQR